MDTIEIDTVFGEMPAHIEITSPMGAGGIYHVMINKFYNGQIIRTQSGLSVYLHPETILQGDDVSVIIGFIEEKGFLDCEALLVNV